MPKIAMSLKFALWFSFLGMCTGDVAACAVLVAGTDALCSPLSRGCVLDPGPGLHLCHLTAAAPAGRKPREERD